VSDHVPIILIHYGPAAYLRETLKAAVRSNPGKPIRFLGDDSNKKFVPCGYDYFPLTKFAAEEQRIVVDSRGAFFAFPESVPLRFD